MLTWGLTATVGQALTSYDEECGKLLPSPGSSGQKAVQVLPAGTRGLKTPSG